MDTIGYVLDIETAPIAGVEDYIEEQDAPSNYKNPEAIAKYKAEARVRDINKAAVNIDLCRIVAVVMQAIGAEHEDTQWGMVARNEVDERALLGTVWAWLRGSGLSGLLTIVGHNVLSFDVPVLMRRSMYLGVPFVNYAVGRWRHDRIIDTQQILSFDGMLPYRSKDFYCRRFGIVESGDTITGAGVGACIARGDYETVLNHCKTDVRKEYRLAEAIGAIHS